LAPLYLPTKKKGSHLRNWNKLPVLALSLLLMPATAAADEAEPAPSVKIVSRKNPGDLGYKWVYGIQRDLNGWLPAEPRLTDFGLRVMFVDMAPAQADAFLPDDWGVAIVGDTVDQTVAIRRGGYFDLPDVPKARDEGATLMFHTQTKSRTIGVAWHLRSDGKSLAYQDFIRALDEVKASQKNVPFYRIGARHIKYAKVDAVKACFAAPDGKLEVEGAAPLVRGQCALLTHSAALQAANPLIRFSGPIVSLTLEDSRDW
jgi:hypothetical protein